MKFLKSISFLMLIICYSTSGQYSNEMNDLLKKIELETNDSIKFDLYDELGRWSYGEDTSVFNQALDPAFALAQEIGFQKGEIDVLYWKGWNLNSNARKSLDMRRLQNRARALFYLVHQKSIEADYKLGERRGLNALGYILNRLGQYDSAVVCLKRGLELSRAAQDFEEFKYSIDRLRDTYSAQKKYEKAIEYSQMALDYFSADTSMIFYISYLHTSLSGIYYDLGSYDKSIAHMDTVVSFIDQIDDPEYISSESGRAGSAYYKMGQYASAINLYEKSLRFAKQIKSETLISLAIFDFGSISRSQMDFERANSYYRRFLEFENSDPYTMALANYYIATAHLQSNHLDSAQYYYQKFLSFREKAPIQMAMPTLIFKAKYALASGKTDSAHVTVEKLLSEFSDSKHHIHDFYEAHSILGEILYVKEKYSESIEAFGVVLNGKTKFVTPIYNLESLEGLSKNYEALGDYKHALEYRIRFTGLQDSLLNNINTQKLAKIESDNLRQKELVKHNEELAKHKEEQANEEKIMQVSLLSSGFLIVILAILYFFYRSKVKSNRKLKVLNQEKNKIIGVVAHDLRSPLNSVKGLVNIFKLEKDEEEKERYMDLITVSTDRMTDMVNRVLDISALESQKFDLRLEKINLVELMNRLMINFQMSAAKKNQEVLFATECQEAIIELDKNYLIQVLENLVSNALKYSEKNTATTLTLQKSGDKVRLSVLDQGPGISEEEQKLLFKEFSTLTSKTTGGEKATGLGLSIVKKYVEAMKGKIWCDSNLGEGSSFNIEFTVAR